MTLWRILGFLCAARFIIYRNVKMFKGEFVIHPGTPQEIIVPNNVMENGQFRFMEALFHQATRALTSFDIGLFDEVPAHTADLADVSTEPSAAGGYARITRTSAVANWSLTTVNGETYSESTIMTWTATGAAFSRAFSRLFIMETGGEILAYSSPLPNPITLLDTQSFSAQYRLFNR